MITHEEDETSSQDFIPSSLVTLSATGALPW